MKTIPQLMALALLALLPAMISGCGVKGPPLPPVPASAEGSDPAVRATPTPSLGK